MLREIISKADVANVVAGVILIVTTVYAALFENVEILKYLASFAAGYLFSKAVRAEYEHR